MIHFIFLDIPTGRLSSSSLHAFSSFSSVIVDNSLASVSNVFWCIWSQAEYSTWCCWSVTNGNVSCLPKGNPKPTWYDLKSPPLPAYLPPTTNAMWKEAQKSSLKVIWPITISNYLGIAQVISYPWFPKITDKLPSMSNSISSLLTFLP